MEKEWKRGNHILGGHLLLKREEIITNKLTKIDLSKE